MNQEQQAIVHNLRVYHIWDERLMSMSLFGKQLRRLTPRETFILEERVCGNSIKNIATLLHISYTSVNTRCREIKRIFETGERNDSLMSKLAYHHNDFYRKLRARKDAGSEERS